MASKGKTLGAANAYARALLELATERQMQMQVGDEMRSVRELLEANPTFASFLRDPGIGATERTATLTKVFQGRVSPLLFNTLRVMNDHDRLGILGQVAEQYQQQLDKQMGKIEVDVTVAQRLDPQTLEQVRQRVSTALGKDAVVRQVVDESIIGGLVLRVEDKLIDASVRSQLESMKQRLMAAAPR
jgi:F-type H+-transporting ATPase subunit delta